MNHPGEELSNTSGSENSSVSPPESKTRRRFDWHVAVVIGVAVVSIPLWRLVEHRSKITKTAAADVTVAVTIVTRADLGQDLVFDAELRPYQEIDMHAKVAGYLEKILVDIGDRVEAGQLLATIEIPELDEEINRAIATQKRSEQEVNRAQAAFEEAHVAFDRLANVDKSHPNLIAQQDLDTARARDLSATSALASAKDQVEIAKAELNKLRATQRYSKMTAPFAGVITKRYANPGALIQAGVSSSTQAMPLVRLSENTRLRVDFPVQVSAVPLINVGDDVEIRIESLKRPVTGKVSRFTRKVETATRTMEVEVELPDPDLKLVPGMYASARMRLNRRDHVLVVPVEAVERTRTATAFVVNRDGKIEERILTLGLETPDKLEIQAGLKENELVMIGGRTQVKPGQKVNPKIIDDKDKHTP